MISKTTSAETKTGYGSTVMLLILGVLALYAGAGWLPVLISAALLVWYGGHRLASIPRTDRS